MGEETFWLSHHVTYHASQLHTLLHRRSRRVQGDGIDGPARQKQPIFNEPHATYRPPDASEVLRLSIFFASAIPKPMDNP